MSSTVGAEKIGRSSKSPVVKLPPHPRKNPKGLTHEEVRSYMLQCRQLFMEGRAFPVSDVGLISTQEDVIRRPMLNHVAAFANESVRAYLLVQRTSTDKGWGYFSIVQDLTVKPVVDYYGDLNGSAVKFEGTSCYKCHSSGPLAIHPARKDLVIDAVLAAELNQHIASQPRSVFYFPREQPAGDYGRPLALPFCASCHSESGIRAPLYRNHAHPIRVLTDFGFMPPGRRLSKTEVGDLKAWLEGRDTPSTPKR